MARGVRSRGETTEEESEGPTSREAGFEEEVSGGCSLPSGSAGNSEAGGLVEDGELKARESLG